MDVRELIELADERGLLHHMGKQVSAELEMARVIHALGEELVIFDDVANWSGRVVAGLFGSRDYLALFLDCGPSEVLGRMVQALANPSEPAWDDLPACQQMVRDRVDLDELPILTHFGKDGGPYVTSGVAIINDPVTGPNAAFHRLMQIAPDRFAVRLVENRGTHTAWSRTIEDLPMVVCIGAPPAVQLAAAMSPAAGVNELHIANALTPIRVCKSIEDELVIPADTEIVLEGRLTHEMVDEGPFVDLTQTRDFVRQQPVFVVERITHRREPIYQALLPGGAEHKVLMGTPREPTIYASVNEVCRCTDVTMTAGGGYWLHAVVQIDKQRPADGKLAGRAAFKGHTSLKHVVVVDHDVNIHDPEQVAWAIATRFQADRDLELFTDQPSSSLDPSARHVPGKKTRTAKLALDATIHWDSAQAPDMSDYAIEDYEPIDLADYE